MSGTGTAVALPARRRADVFSGEVAGSGRMAAAGAVPADGATGEAPVPATLPAAEVSGASSSGGLSAPSRELLPGAGIFFRPRPGSREGAGSSACLSAGRAGAFLAGASPCGAFFSSAAAFSGRDGDARPQASSSERAVVVMTDIRLRGDRLLVSSPAAEDRPEAASEGEDMELLDYIQIG